MRVPVAPYLTAPPQCVKHGGWHLRTPDGDVPLPTDLEHWDYQTVLGFAAAVTVDREALALACDLDSDSGLAVLVTARSDHSRLEQRACLVEVPPQNQFDLALTFDLTGESLGGRLTLDTFLVASAPRPLSPLAASRPGSILWRVSHSTHLEGEGAQFPTDAEDFTITRPDAKDAGWILSVDVTDPEARFLACVRLTLNSSLPSIERLMQGASDEATLQLNQVLQWDVTRQLACVALETDEVLTLQVDQEATSLAGVLRNILAQVWPHESPETLRHWMITDRSHFERTLQSKAGPFK